MQAFVTGKVGVFFLVLFLFGRKWNVACACVGSPVCVCVCVCECVCVCGGGGMNAKWQGLISFAETLS